MVQHSAQFKARVALLATQYRQPSRKLARRVGVAPERIQEWKQRLIMRAPELFAGGNELDRLRQEREQLRIELDWLQRAAAARPGAAPEADSTPSPAPVNSPAVSAG